VFNCSFLQLDHEVSEVLEIFDLLDRNGDGSLDQKEFDGLFNGIQGGWNSHKHAITQSILRPGMHLGKNIDIMQGYNTLDKFGPNHQE
jgi:Ca2+-binding EF-hand superfamily protein